MCPWCEGETPNVYLTKGDYTKDPPVITELKMVECDNCNYIGPEIWISENELIPPQSV